MFVGIVITRDPRCQKYILNDVMCDAIVIVHNKARTHFLIISQSAITPRDELDLNIVTDDNESKWIDYCEALFYDSGELIKSANINIFHLPQINKYIENLHIHLAEYEWMCINDHLCSYRAYIVHLKGDPMYSMPRIFKQIANKIFAYMYKINECRAIVIADISITPDDIHQYIDCFRELRDHDVIGDIDEMFTPGENIILSNACNLSMISELRHYYRMVNYVIFKAQK